MKEEKNLTCIVCPVGCSLSVMVEGGQILLVEGNTCKRGESYAKTELTNPRRRLTTTVVIDHGTLKRLPVFTEGEIPKGLINEAMIVLSKVRVEAPIALREVVVENLLGTGINVLASRSMFMQS